MVVRTSLKCRSFDLLLLADEVVELGVLGDVVGDEGADDVDLEVFVAGAL